MLFNMKINLSALMKLAWRFVKLNGYTMAEAMKTAWLNFKLRARMKAGIVKFYFQKVNGSIREAFGTLKDVPATQGVKTPSPLVQTYFDTEKQDWRCYKLANLISIA